MNFPKLPRPPQLAMASTGPRPRGRGMHPHRPRPPKLIMTSTGPRPRGRGMAATTSSPTPSTSLQRGRARAGAEWVVQSGVTKQNCHFNGAAPARARNGQLWNDPRRRDYTSTGPRPRGRGMDSYEHALASSSLTSTGPRPRGRGMNAKIAHSQLVPIILQRGRARAGAECQPRRPPPPLRRRDFNGAAPARARNVDVSI